MIIFISYRRDDSRHITDRIYDRLVARFGKKTIFKDVDSIPLGTDFRQTLKEAMSKCNVLLVIIGDRWLEITDPAGHRRLDDPDDFVRLEIEAALSRGIPVIPILVDKATMPPTNNVPKSLQQLSYRNGTVVRPDPDFHRDMDRVVKVCEECRPPGEAFPEPVRQHAFFAFQVGYALVEMSRCAEGVRLSNDLTTKVSHLFQAARAISKRLCKSLGIEPFEDLSLQDFDHGRVFCYYNEVFRTFESDVFGSYQLGRDAGRILLHLIPGFGAFTVQGEPRAREFLQAAWEDLDRMASIWSHLFGGRSSATIDQLKSRLVAIEAEVFSLDNLGALVSQCTQLGDEFRAEFQQACKVAG